MNTAYPEPEPRPESESETELETAQPTLAAQELRLTSALVVILGLGLFLALPFVLSIGSIVFLPLVSAMILSIVLSPLADRLAGWGLPNMLASLLALLAFLGLSIAVVLLIFQPAFDLIDKVPQMVGQVSREVSQLRGNLSWINDLNRQLARMTGHVGAREVVIAGPSVIEQVAFSAPQFVLEVLFTLLLTYFMIESRTRMRRRLLLDRVSFGASLKAARAIREVQDRVAGYILTVASINLGVGLIVGLGAWGFGLGAPVMWGGIAFVLNFLPYVGPLTMIAILALFGLGTEPSLLAGIAPAAAYLGLHTIEANVVTPSILGARFTVSPVLILLSISYFSWVWGVFGALLSIPIMLTLAAVIEQLGKPNLIGFLFGEPLFVTAPDLGDEVGGESQPG